MKWQEERQLVLVAKMYYEEALTQNEISKRLGVYRTTVTRMLQKARDEGIVQIKIASTHRVRVNLENELCKKFGLLEAVVVPIESQTRDERLEALGQSGAELLDRILIDGDVVGLAWGDTLGTMSEVMSSFKKRDATFVPIVGGPGKMHVKHHINTIVYNFARAFKARSQYIDAAAIVESADAQKEISRSAYLQDVLKLWQQMTVAVIGIGALFRSSNLVWSGFIGEEEKELLEEKKVIGDILSRFYTIDGKEAQSTLSERTIAIELERLRKNRTTIAIAESKEKVPSIIGALHGGYITHLVTDEETANDIMKWGGTK
ncbi:sugar-binding transcriptional regulator [Shouchella patagoniensis]|uniref:sugar-binding transcriptional regulator n=1 Tax=Shouchella patagoniensis TaxID=228576 RepID=UPI0014731FAA|nr:sugar-binding transcriptional regulator [Shouchella patagoniensis]